MDGYYAIYRLTDGFVLRVGMCGAGSENDQVIDARNEGVVYCDRLPPHPDTVRVAAGRLVPKNQTG